MDKQGSWTVFHSSNSPLWDDKVNDIDIDADSIVWLANDAASIAHNSFGTWTNVFFPSGIAFARAICIDYKGAKWVATQEGLVKFADGGAGPIFTFRSTARRQPMPLVFPNPSTGHFSILQWEKPFTSLHIYDGMGVLVGTKVLQAHQAASVSIPLAPGSYLLRFSRQDGRACTLKHLVLPYASLHLLSPTKPACRPACC
jgi:hypothetical protein